MDINADGEMVIDPKPREAYTIGWVCALPKEQIAAITMLDERHPNITSKSPNDENIYTLGSIGPHNIIITCLPLKCYGTCQTSRAISQMHSTFPSIKITFIVGIGAGIPSKVKLGDVVISTEWAKWDFGKTNKDGVFEHTGRKSRPSDGLLTIMSKIQTEHSLRGETRVPEYIRNLGLNYPHLAPKYVSIGDPEEIKIHYGMIASGCQVIKDAKLRDSINQQLGGQVLCLEMEAAGLVGFPAVVIRGICDYADSNKNDDWQEYAAAAAAACAKEFINRIEPAAAAEVSIMKEDLDRVIDEIAILRGNLSGDEERKVLEWITPIDDSTQHNDFLNRRQSGTGEWMLNSSVYQNWLNTPKEILYCPGIPGAGKTILTSIIIDNLIDRYSHNPEIGIAYVYFNFKGSARLRIDDILSSILKQLVRTTNETILTASKTMRTQASLPRCIKELYDRYKGSRPPRSDIMKSIYAVSAAYSRVFIVIDALDEYQDRSEFLEKLFEIHDHQNLNIFATSRPIPEIRHKFKRRGTYKECEIRASDEDVKQYLEGKILQLGTNVVKVNKETIKDKISELAQGINETTVCVILVSLVPALGIPILSAKKAQLRFLLAHFQFEAIKAAPTLKAVKKILGSFTNGGGASNSVYDSTYRAIMEKIQGNSNKELADMAFKVLMWVTCASRRLNKAELQHAIATEPEEPASLDRDNISDIDDLISTCLGLVTIDEESNIVRLIHYTAQEYLEREKKLWFLYPHSSIAKVCTIYLSYDVFKSGPCESKEDLEERLGLNPLYRYAAENLGYHARESSREEQSYCLEPGAGSCTFQIGVTQHILKLLLDDDLRLACVQVPLIRGGRSYYRHQKRADIDQMQALHVAAHLGLAQAAELLLARSGVDLEAKENKGKTPLSLAAERGQDDVVKVLIKYGANLEAKDNHLRTPLYFAAMWDKEETTKLLVGYGADVAAGCYWGSTPLKAAVDNGCGGVIRFLVDRMTQMEIKRVTRDVALASALYGYQDVLKSMLERGVDLKTVDDNDNGRYGRNRNLLWNALYGGHEGIVKLLLDIGVDPNQKYTKSRLDGESRPLIFAIENGLESVVRLLVDKADLEAEAADCRTPLSVSVEKRRQDLVELLLLEKGVRVTAPALSAAFKNKDEDMVNLLLERKQDPDGADSRGNTLLCAAARHGHEAAIRLLISEGADIEAKSEYGLTPLLTAVDELSEVAVRLLVEANIKIGRDKSKVVQEVLFGLVYGSPEAENIIDYLIEMGADLEGESGQKALSIAKERGDGAMVECLLGEGVRPTAGLLPWAVLKRYEGVVRLLIDMGADLDDTDDCRRTGLFFAAINGYLSIVKTLVEAGADLEASDDDGDTPLAASVLRGHHDVVEFLLERGAHIETEDKCGETPLFLAAREGKAEIVGLLIQNGANLEALNNDHKTPLSIAAENGHESTVRLLVDKGAYWGTQDENGKTPSELATGTTIAQFLAEMVYLRQIGRGPS
ncbi:hypothetical protein TWF192_007105 [Orbilia oligospora]|uniref:Uncharacterized protein n=1 Tax=Orbilia oligospora TaxID=2813651 RepID=A0A6G1MKV9_ORBOL|nr:hypothetical protein TWF191_000282 [Orbilia oligospora]KAF3262430.1 hypothetical protein TWF192_007105 [Orbilia oligospora]